LKTHNFGGRLVCDDGSDHFCPRDGTPLSRPDGYNRSAFSDHGIFHCSTCSGMLLNAEAASNSMSENKLRNMHEAFETNCEEVNLDCPCCDTHMRVRRIVFRRVNGTEMDPIEIDGCPVCSTFWFDAGELQRIVNPDETPYEEPGREASALLLALEILILLPHRFV